MTQRIITKIFGWGGTFAAMALILAIWLGGIYGGKIEGRYFPVVVNTAVTEIERVGDIESRVWGSSEKVRQCAFERIEWYIGSEDAYSRVAVSFEERSKARPDGDLSFGPWLIRMTPEEVLHRSFAVVVHRCHPLWLTETRFYP
jgi:hypothetical protein